MSSEPPAPDGSERSESAEIAVMLHHRSYLALLLVAALLGIPLSVIAFGFLAVVHELEHYVWHTIPHDFGYDVAPPWWPIALLTLAGVLVGLAVTRLPGHGGHVPVDGISAGATPASHLPGVALAAAASLVLGAVIGPEAPLLAIGSGLAVLAVRHTKRRDDPTATALLAATGAAAALSSIFGNPLVAAVMLLEALGLGRRQTTLVIVPCLVSSGIGAMIFTGLGDWTGLGIGALALPDLEEAPLVAADLVWVLPVAACIAVGTAAIFAVGKRTAGLAAARPMRTTIVAGLVAGCAAAFYSWVTGHSPTDVAMSGQATLSTLASHPGQWSTGALVLLVICKGIAYAVCLGTFRGGAVFPALFLGAAAGVLASTWFPGVATVPGLAIGMAAGVAVIRLPVTGILLVSLLLGSAAANLMPIIIIAAVVALIVDELLESRRMQPDSDPLAG